MSDIKKVTVEEFDDEGNLVKRTVTEYDETGRATGGVIKRGIPVPADWYQGFVATNPDKYQIMNLY